MLLTFTCVFFSMHLTRSLSLFSHTKHAAPFPKNKLPETRHPCAVCSSAVVCTYLLLPRQLSRITDLDLRDNSLLSASLCGGMGDGWSARVSHSHASGVTHTGDGNEGSKGGSGSGGGCGGGVRVVYEHTSHVTRHTETLGHGVPEQCGADVRLGHGAARGDTSAGDDACVRA